MGGNLSHTAGVMVWHSFQYADPALKNGNSIVLTPLEHLFLDLYQADIESVPQPIAADGLNSLETVYAFSPIPAGATPEQIKLDQNRLGIALQLALLRFPGTALLADETPPRELINFLALQLHVPSSAWGEYAQRDETRREHLLELQTHYGIHSFTLGQYRSLAAWLLSTGLQTNRGIALVRAAIEELRRRHSYFYVRCCK
jgi:hypothetical protein